MNITTKFDIGNKAVAISRTGVQLPPEECSACGGSGMVELRGEQYHCPRCNGKRVTQRTGHGWVITDGGTVADIRIEYIRIEYGPSFGDRSYGDQDFDHGELRVMVQYFLNQYGSGTLYDEPNLFATREEAQAECDKRNGYAGARSAW